MDKIPYQEIDFLVPAQCFRIQFSYATKQGLSFIREFMLRIISLSPIEHKHLAEYFGLSKRELDAAVSDLLERGDIRILTNGLITLTQQSENYFESMGGNLQVSEIVSTTDTFCFEMADFNYIGNKKSNEKWKNGMPISIPPEQLAISEQLAKKHFQSQFYSLFDAGKLDKLKKKDDKNNRPTIYKIESVHKLFQTPLRIKQKFSIDIEGTNLEREYLDEYQETTNLDELITKTIYNSAKGNNIEAIFSAMDSLEDTWSRKLLTKNNYIDVTSFLQERGKTEYGKLKTVPFIGNICLENNWNLIKEKLDSILSKLKKQHLDSVDDLIWIAPSDSFWGKNDNFIGYFDDLIKKSKDKKTFYRPKFYVPLSSEDNKYEKDKWKRECSDIDKFVYGLIEGFLDGNVEIILLPKRLVVVCYHFSIPDVYSITFPLGFISTEENMLKKVELLAQEYISGFVEADKPRNLGLIEKF